MLVNDNINSLRVFGGSASLHVNLPKGFLLHYTFNVARTQHKDGTVDQRLPLWYGNFRVGWQSGDDGYSVMLLGVYSSVRSILYNASPTSFNPYESRVDLRLAAAGPIKSVKGLSWRLAFGASLNAAQPYVLAEGDSLPRGHVLYPVQTRLFGFAGLNYNYAGF